MQASAPQTGQTPEPRELTFAALVELEPALEPLLAEASSWRHRQRPRNWWRAKRSLVRLRRP